MLTSPSSETEGRAFAEHFKRDTLANVAFTRAVLDQAVAGPAEDIDKPRRDRQPGDVDRPRVRCRD